MTYNQTIKWAFIFAFAALATIMPDIAMAQIDLDSSIGKSLCELILTFTGKTGTAIASMAVIFLGIGAFFGKVNWGLAFLTAAAIIAIFASAAIVGSLGSNTACA